MTAGILHTGDGGSSDRNGYFIPEMVGAVTEMDTPYRRWWEQQQECHFILEMAGAVTGGRLHTSDGGSGDRRQRWWEW